MCFSASTRRCTSRCLKFFSVLLFLLSIGLITASFVMFKPLKQKIQFGKLHTQYDIEGNVVAQKLCRFGGMGGIVMSILAYLTAKQKVPYFAFPFILGAFAMGGLFTVVFITTIDQETALYYKKETCNVLMNAGKKEGTKLGSVIAKNTNIHFIDMHMCSRTCPCPKSTMHLWKGMYEEKDLKERLRTWNGNTDPPYTPMNFNVDDFKEDDKKKGFDTFEECYHDKLRDHPEVYGNTAESKQAYEDFTERNSFNLLRHYEQEFQCSGVCDLPLFYLTKSVQDGPPSEQCTDAVIKSLADDYLVAAISCIGAFSFFAAGFSAFPNCCTTKKSRERAAYKQRMKNYGKLEDENEMTNYQR